MSLEITKFIPQHVLACGKTSDGRIFPFAVDETGKVMVAGCLQYRGTWDADTNDPELSDSGGGGSKGDYYVVSVTGSTEIDGQSTWNVGDWIVNNGVIWQKADHTDSVTSVNGRQGAVTGLLEDDGSSPLTADWDAGSYDIKSNTFTVPNNKQYYLEDLGGTPRAGLRLTTGNVLVVGEPNIAGGMEIQAGGPIDFSQAYDVSVRSTLLFCDVSENRVGINKGTPAVALDVVGAITSDSTITGSTITDTSLSITTGAITAPATVVHRFGRNTGGTVDSNIRVNVTTDAESVIEFYTKDSPQAAIQCTPSTPALTFECATQRWSNALNGTTRMQLTGTALTLNNSGGIATGTYTLETGVFAIDGNFTSGATVEGATITDSVASMSSGALSGVTTIGMSSVLTSDAVALSRFGPESAGAGPNYANVRVGASSDDLATSDYRGGTTVFGRVFCDVSLGSILYQDATTHRWRDGVGGPTVIMELDSSKLDVAGDVWVGTNNAKVDGIIALGIDISDETSDLTTGTGKRTFRMPWALTLTAVRANVNTAPTGSTIVVDINEGGSTILSTKLSIDAGEETSTTAATPPVISDSALADDAEITVDIDQIGSSTAGKGLKIWLIGYKPSS